MLYQQVLHEPRKHPLCVCVYYVSSGLYAWETNGRRMCEEAASTMWTEYQLSRLKTLLFYDR